MVSALLQEYINAGIVKGMVKKEVA